MSNSLILDRLYKDACKEMHTGVPHNFMICTRRRGHEGGHVSTLVRGDDAASAARWSETDERDLFTEEWDEDEIEKRIKIYDLVTWDNLHLLRDEFVDEFVGMFDFNSLGTYAQCILGPGHLGACMKASIGEGNLILETKIGQDPCKARQSSLVDAVLEGVAVGPGSDGSASRAGYESMACSYVMRAALVELKKKFDASESENEADVRE